MLPASCQMWTKAPGEIRLDFCVRSTKDTCVHCLQTVRPNILPLSLALSEHLQTSRYRSDRAILAEYIFPGFRSLTSPGQSRLKTRLRRGHIHMLYIWRLYDTAAVSTLEFSFVIESVQKYSQQSQQYHKPANLTPAETSTHITYPCTCSVGPQRQQKTKFRCWALLQSRDSE